MTSFWRRNGSSVPLGVDLGADSVSIVAAQASPRGFTVTETRTQAVGPARSGNVDLAIAETVRELISSLKTRERRCVLGAPAGDVVTRTFRMPPRMGRREAERAAALEADALVDWPASERVVALDPLPGKPLELLLSIARTGPIDRLVAIARAGGLRPVAVDTTACAWRRAVPDADAILDCASDRAVLEIFGDPIGVTHVFPPRLIDDRLASQMRSAFVEARRDGVADVGRLVVLASRFRFESLEELLRDDGCTVAALTLGDVEVPTWSFAYGLATWSLASYAYPVTAR